MVRKYHVKIKLAKQNYINQFMEDIQTIYVRTDNIIINQLIPIIII